MASSSFSQAILASKSTLSRRTDSPAALFFCSNCFVPVKRPLLLRNRCCGIRVPRVAAEVLGDDRAVEEDERREKGKVLRVGLVCGGPSAERGISLNSARSVLDHIQGDDLHVSCYYIDCNLKAYAISPAQVYSNTPADFDFKLESLAQGFESLSDFAEHLTGSVDIVFPVIHGRFGEDGGIQEILEKSNIPFVGTWSDECRKAFDKVSHASPLRYLVMIELLKKTRGERKARDAAFLIIQYKVEMENSLWFCEEIDYEGGELDESDLSEWFLRNQLDTNLGKVIVKPTKAGSSIGVTVAYGVTDSLRKANEIISEGIDDRVLVEIFLEGGSEFTSIVLDVGSGFDCQPVALLPTEVELQFHGSADVNEKDAIFNYRRKYLPTQQVAYHTPPRFPLDVINSIREGASLLFQWLGLRDFARIDGWFLPASACLSSSSENKFGKTESGTIIFTDINMISGMEQTSFLFQQASKVAYHTPPRFPLDVINSIREGASLLFQRLGLRDFARIDGWFLPPSACLSSSSENKFGKTESGTIIFTDINLWDGANQLLISASFKGTMILLLCCDGSSRSCDDLPK
ncbi:hypothetical protein TEA_007907 [Camellia sinensis var. sinensis]|uniref:ATP-grasp domain-containing protein n=1 Tax=Camellia sinensis var. sinensis TaxID=542762 RepID=A0A4S4E0N1_CAMSN|nr:hypothetical protein TEA_007907 [Camellia sinensis var. sinensis]